MIFRARERGVVGDPRTPLFGFFFGAVNHSRARILFLLPALGRAIEAML